MTTFMEFYTKDHCYQINHTTNSVRKDGEIIAEGKIFVYELLMGYPAWIIVTPQNEYCPPIYLRTATVQSVLPGYERFDGETVHRTYFLFRCAAMDQIHAKMIFRLSHHQKIKEIFSENELIKQA